MNTIKTIFLLIKNVQTKEKISLYIEEKVLRFV